MGVAVLLSSTQLSSDVTQDTGRAVFNAEMVHVVQCVIMTAGRLNAALPTS